MSNKFSNTVERVDPSHNYFRLTVMTGPTTIILPASNVNGIVIYGIHNGVVLANNTAIHRVMGKSSTPTGWNDAGANTYALTHNNASGNQLVNSNICFPMFVPASIGLYEWSSDGTTLSVCAVLYEVL